MSIPGKLLIAVLASVLVSFIVSTFSDVAVAMPLLSALASSILAVLLGHRPLAMPDAIANENTSHTAPTPASAAPKQASAAGNKPGQAPKKTREKTAQRASATADGNAAPTSGPREEGTVKWFNATKGFGFVIRDSGEEIFVHYRSIRGEGRRSLRDGQAVRFTVEQTGKGPQAEDVEALD